MCEMLNVFVPVARPKLGTPVRGFHLVADGTVQRDLSARFAEHGAILDGRTGSDCMCGFEDWPAVYEVARDLLIRNAVEYVAILKFWAGDRYALPERVVDPDDPETCTPGGVGELIVVRGGPAEPRRHRIVVRTLVRRVGAPVTLRLKSGRALHGTLAAFDPESEVGALDGHVVIAGQVLAVEPDDA